VVNVINGLGTSRRGVAVAQLTRSEVERVGRRRTFLRAGLLGLALLLAQLPLRSAVGAWSPDSGQSFLSGCVVPTRLALLLDAATAVVAVVLAHRTLQLIRIEADWPSRLRTAGASLFWVVVVTAGLTFVEDLLLWNQAVTPDAGGCAPLWVTTTLGEATVPYTLVVRVLFTVTLAELLFVRLLAFRSHGHPKPDFVLNATGPAAATTASRNGAALAGTIICCAGGGVRGAAFALGGLQQLVGAGIYRSARAVVGVSGGGYAAASYHVLRATSTLRGYAVPPYDRISPEMTRLRRQTDNLQSSPWVASQGVLSLLLGMAINVLLVLVYLRLAAWLLGWVFSEYAVVTGLDTATSHVSFDDAPGWLAHVWWLPTAGIGLFLSAKLLERVRTAGFMLSRRLMKLTVALTAVGLAASAMLLGVPVIISGLHNLATSNEPTPTVAGLLHAMGFASTAACAAAGSSACGVTGPITDASRSDVWTAAGLVVIVLAILAVVRAAQASVEEAGPPAWGRPFAHLRETSRDVVLPWISTVVIAVSFLAVFLRWTADLTRAEDLRSQWWVAAWCIAFLLVTKFATDANRTSLHHFSRERLSQAYLVRRNGEIAEPVPYQDSVRFAEIVPHDGGPVLVMCAAANLHDADFVAAERDCTPFVFDASAIGLTDATLPGGAAMTQARLYEHRADARFRDATIPATMAVSGAAFSTLTGRRSVRSGSYRFVLALANARLGLWLPNPYWIDPAGVVVRLVSLGMSKEAFKAVRALSPADLAALRLRLGYEHDHWVNAVLAVPKDAPNDVPVPHLPNVSSLPLWLRRLGWYVRSGLDKPGPYRLLKEALGKSSIFDRKLYVTDGGNYDGVGLVEALRRRPAEIFILDGSREAADSFRALGEAVATARMDLGVEVRLDVRAMRRTGEGRAQAAWVKGSATYPDGRTATVYVAKALMTDGMPADVEAYASSDPAFPSTSGGHPLRREWELEAYRVLGREATRLLLRNEWEPPAGEREPADVGDGLAEVGAEA
jgi:hypothetical protein